MIGEAGSGPGTEDGSAEETETDEAEVAGLVEALFAGVGRGVRGEGFVETLGYVAEVAGDERGVVGEAVDAAEAGDLNCCDVGDDAGECHVGEAAREPAEDKDGGDLQPQAKEDGTYA